MLSTVFSPRVARTFGFLTVVLLPACFPPTAPNDDDIEDVFRAQTATLAGQWRGFSQLPSNELRVLDFSIAQTGSTVSGSGVMHEHGRPDSIPITVTGSYNVPRATLTISGMQFEGRAVTGLLRATNSAGIMVDTLVLSGANYERKLAVFISRP